MTESEKRARDLWEMCNHNIPMFTRELALTTHMTHEEIKDAITSAIIATVTDILDGETVG